MSEIIDYNLNSLENVIDYNIKIMLEVKDKNLSAIKCINSTTVEKKITQLFLFIIS